MRHASKPEIEVPRKASFTPALGGGERATGWIVRLSVAGAEIESLQPPAIGSEIVVTAELVPGEGEVSMRGRVQWAKASQFAVQFRGLGVRETSALVRVARRSVA